MNKYLLCMLSALCLSMAAPASIGEEPAKLFKPGTMDLEFMQQQRDRIDELARINLGRQLQASRDNDIGILQALLERRLVRADQTLELQAMGVVLGDLLAKELSMHWIIYEDGHGRSRALQMGESENVLFPVTMISRRAEAGATVDVMNIYQKAVNLMAPYRPKLPFQ